MSSVKGNNLGEFEILVLGAILRQAGQAYGASIRREMEDRTGRSPSLGALYATLTRLEAKGCIRSTMGEATAQRGGKAKRYYEIEAAGLAQLERSIANLISMTKGTRIWPASS